MPIAGLLASALFMFVAVVNAQITTGPSKAAETLVLDATKPLVYIGFDHVGARKPVADGEPAKGLWLRLVNNSTIPIVVRANGSATDPEMTLLPDTIIPVRRRIPKSGAGRDKMPAGYASDVGTLLSIEPGKAVLFSVPSSHVSRNWYMQVPFQFDLPAVKQGSQPVCLAEFTWEDIPMESR